MLYVGISSRDSMRSKRKVVEDLIMEWFLSIIANVVMLDSAKKFDSTWAIV